MATDLSAALGPEEQGTDLFSAMFGETINAVKMMVGAYKPASPEEEQRLRRRFFADAASIGVGVGATALTSGLAIPAIARLILGTIGGGAASGAVAAGIEGGNVPQQAAIGAAVSLPFAGLGMIPGAMRKGAAEAAERAAAAKTAQLGQADKIIAGMPERYRGLNIAPGLEEPALGTVAPQSLDIEAIVAGARGGTPRYNTPITRPAPTGEEFLQSSALIDPITPMSGTPILERGAAALRDPRTLAGLRESLGESPLPPDLGGPGIRVRPFNEQISSPAQMDLFAPPGQQEMFGPVDLFGAPAPRTVPGSMAMGHGMAAGTPTSTIKTILDFGSSEAPTSLQSVTGLLSTAGGKGPVTEQAIRVAINDLREYVKKLGREPRTRIRQIRARRKPLQYESSVEGYDPAADLESLNRSIDGVLQDMPSDPSRFMRAWEDVKKIWRRGVLISGHAISKMGTAGAWLAQTMSKVVNESEAVASPFVTSSKALSRGLTKKEIYEISGILHGDTVASSTKTAEIAARLRVMLDDVGRMAQEADLREMSWRSGKVRPFTYTENYFPLTYPKEVLKKYLNTGSVEHKRAVEKILELRMGPKTYKEGADLLNRFLTTPPEFRYGHLQFARELSLPDFERDWTKVLPHYFQRALRRIETAKAFGPTDDKVLPALRQMALEGYDAEMARDVFRAFTDRTPRGYTALVHLTRTFNIISLLSTAGLVQFAQHSNTLAYVGFKNFMKGLAAYSSKEGRAWAAKTGAYLQELIGEIGPDIGAAEPRNAMERLMHLPMMPTNPALWRTIMGPNRAAAWLQFIGLTPLDKANRIIASLAGRAHADEVAGKFFRQASTDMQGAMKRHGRELQRLGLTPEEVMAGQGVLSEDQRLKAAQAVSHITQFRGSVLDMPAWKSTTVPGQFAYLFKTFSIQQFRFTNTLLQEARRGNFAPALKYLAASATWTPMVGAAVRELRARPVPENPYWNVLEASLNAGAVGIAYDALKAVEGGPERLFGFFAGPTASQAVSLATKGAGAIQGNPAPLVRDILRHTPLFGPQVADYFVPRE